MKIAGLFFDDENLEKMDKHGINALEVEQACSGPHVVNPCKFGRYVLYGQAQNGKYVKVILEYLGKAQYRPVTAYEMTASDKQRFKKKIK